MVFVHPIGDTLFHLISLCDVEGFYLFARRLAGASPQILIHCLGHKKNLSNYLLAALQRAIY
jgi:hypothetical protein